MNVYFNTCGVSGAELIERRVKVGTQNDRVLAHFATNPTATPSEVQAATGILIVSVRRAITTLTKQSRLVKTTQYRVGPEGHVEHLWARAA